MKQWKDSAQGERMTIGKIKAVPGENMTESSPIVLDQNHFQVKYGSGNQADIFEALAKHVRKTGGTIETIELSTGSERFQALVTFYAGD